VTAQAIEVEVNLRLLEGEEQEDEVFFCQIHRKKGSPEVFGNFYRRLMAVSPQK